MAPQIVRWRLNDKGQVYAIVIKVENPGGFVRRLWESIGPDGPRDDAEGCKEWTDRARDFRTTVSSEGVYIRTHAWVAQGDTRELHEAARMFLVAEKVILMP